MPLDGSDATNAEADLPTSYTLTSGQGQLRRCG